MPQTFQVLRCFQCLVFQVHPTKKANKWKCKMCGEKQSIKRFYGLGTGKDCRLHVQKLNGIQGESHNTNLKDSDESINSQDEVSDGNEQTKKVPKAINKKSKWTDYVDTIEENEQQVLDKDMHLNKTEVVLELPKKRPRKTQHVINTPDSLYSGNKCLPSSVFNNSTKDKTVESKQFNKSSTDLGHSHLISPTETEIKQKMDLLPTLKNSNSKWAQYIEETEIPNNENPTISDQSDINNAPTIFSLFDGDNIDAVLDI